MVDQNECGVFRRKRLVGVGWAERGILLQKRDVSFGARGNDVCFRSESGDSNRAVPRPFGATRVTLQ
jgi:hypothetical protein